MVEGKRNSKRKPKEYLVETFAGVIHTIPSILAPELTKPSILVRWKGYPGHGTWETMAKLANTGHETAINFFVDKYRTLFPGDFRIFKDGIVEFEDPEINAGLLPYRDFPEEEDEREEELHDQLTKCGTPTGFRNSPVTLATPPVSPILPNEMPPLSIELKEQGPPVDPLLRQAPNVPLTAPSPYRLPAMDHRSPPAYVLAPMISQQTPRKAIPTYPMSTIAHTTPLNPAESHLISQKKNIKQRNSNMPQAPFRPPRSSPVPPRGPPGIPETRRRTRIPIFVEKPTLPRPSATNVSSRTPVTPHTKSRSVPITPYKPPAAYHISSNTRA